MASLASTSELRKFPRLRAGTAIALLGLLGAVAASAHDHAAMSESAMRATRDAWFAKHPLRTGAIDPVTPVVNAAATFSVFNFGFDDGAPTTVDTAVVSVGDTVVWKWTSGTHTVTNGTGPADPNSGHLFNVPSDINHKTFSFVFTNQGLFPFYCSIHTSMQGWVRVHAAVDVPPVAANERIGFVLPPAPNPSHSGVGFTFAVRSTGRVRASVYDAAGRQVAALVDRDYEPGTYAARWDGHTTAGGLARPGTYWVRLYVPGSAQSRRIVLQP